ncbi:hypothetical protein, partial [Staphylococcus epidermidis]|uniref:hypothetical protein n=1 Tax=Staphylococcus epidermidis TaxID=1282 RepID=UPI001C92DCCD
MMKKVGRCSLMKYERWVNCIGRWRDWRSVVDERGMGLKLIKGLNDLCDFFNGSWSKQGPSSMYGLITG